MKSVFKKALVVLFVVLLATSMTSIFSFAAEEAPAAEGGLDFSSIGLDPAKGIMPNIYAIFEYLNIELDAVIVLAIGALGLVQCLFGYKLIRLELFVVGCGIGAFLGYFLLASFFPAIMTSMAIVAYLVMALLGLFFGWLVLRLFRFVMFLIIAAGSFVVGSAVITPMLSSFVPTLANVPMVATLVSVVVSLLIAFLILKIRRPALIILTSLLGAFLAGFFAFNVLLFPMVKASFVVTATLVVVGLIFQFRVGRKSSGFGFATAMILGGLLAESANGKRENLKNI